MTVQKNVKYFNVFFLDMQLKVFQTTFLDYKILINQVYFEKLQLIQTSKFSFAFYHGWTLEKWRTIVHRIIVILLEIMYT